jgi:hypothetical protein
VDSRWCRLDIHGTGCGVWLLLEDFLKRFHPSPTPAPTTTIGIVAPTTTTATTVASATTLTPAA